MYSQRRCTYLGHRKKCSIFLSKDYDNAILDFKFTFVRYEYFRFWKIWQYITKDLIFKTFKKCVMTRITILKAGKITNIWNAVQSEWHETKLRLYTVCFLFTFKSRKMFSVWNTCIFDNCWNTLNSQNEVTKRIFHLIGYFFSYLIF